ncbi:MAG TPA: helix-turn-helix transcriptional regulator [Candidatus Polarisedimenticolaceae bacterium]|nr:helix-turn-helix transcriptional regulator [Candidatus Polarisedimenticolaceae bacterium]
MASQPQAAALKGSVKLGSYLRKLRTGYGYSLRRVEERARAEGGEIDNSQLSRYEKGVCYPSFDKLRILANVFNVSIQSFSDVVDLESFEALKPDTNDAAELQERGLDALKAGDTGLSFALFERAIELLSDGPQDSETQEQLGRARINQAAVLNRLGKLALAEQELRSALRLSERLSPVLQARALLALALIHTDQGDHFLSEMEADRAYQIAANASLPLEAAKALNLFGHVLHQRGAPTEAIERFREAGKLFARCGNDFEANRVRINTGTCYVALGKYREGIRLLREALNEARNAGHRRLEAHAWSNLGEAYYRQDDLRRARGCFLESDALAHHNGEKQPDILFFNAFYEWKMAIQTENPTREKIAFGRLKALRSSLERRTVEVDAFDDYVERGKPHA